MSDVVDPLRDRPPVTPVSRDAASAAFFDAARDGTLLIKQCSACSHFAGPSAVVCSQCGDTSLRETPANGRGVVVSWATVPPRPADGPQPGPVTGGLVELEEGPWIWAGFLIAPERMAAGQAVRVVFVEAGDEMVPFFDEP